MTDANQSPADARDQFEIAYATHIKSTPVSIRALRQGEGYFDGCCTYLQGAWWAWQFLSNAPDAYSPSYKALYETAQQKVNDLMAYAQRLENERQALHSPDSRTAFEAWARTDDGNCCGATIDMGMERSIERSFAAPQTPQAGASRRGTPEQIEFERKLTCEAIEGAIAFGRQNTNPPPSDDHWLAPFWKYGRQLAAPTPQQISEYLNGLDRIERALAEREAREIAAPAAPAVLTLRDLTDEDMVIEWVGEYDANRIGIQGLCENIAGLYAAPAPTEDDHIECGACAVPAPEQEEVRDERQAGQRLKPRRIKWVDDEGDPLPEQRPAAAQDGLCSDSMCSFTWVGPHGHWISGAARDVLAERQRQISGEGFTTGHDDAYEAGEMSLAAAVYALIGSGYDPTAARELWPKCWSKHWLKHWLKPSTRRRDLIKAGALILAEIERIDRAGGD